MIFRVLGEVFERLKYERERVRKLLPVLLRMGISEAEDLLHQFNHWRGACDHSPRPKRGSSKVRRIKRKGKR